jgi:hypothetical protein
MDGVGASSVASAGDSGSISSGGFDSSASSFSSAIDSAGASLSSIGSSDLGSSFGAPPSGSLDSSALTGGTSLSSDLFSPAPLSSFTPSSFGSMSLDMGSSVGSLSPSITPSSFSSPSLLDPAPLSTITPTGFSTNPVDLSSTTPGAFTGLSSTFGPAPVVDPPPVSLPPSQEFSPGDINPVTNNVVTDVTPAGQIVQEAPAVAAPVEPVIPDPVVSLPPSQEFSPGDINPVTNNVVTDVTPEGQILQEAPAVGAPIAPAAHQQPAAPPQIGYGDRPLGVPVSEIGRLTEADAATYVGDRLAEYHNAADRTAKNQALDRALDAAYAWRVQGGDAASFQRIIDSVAGDQQDALTAQVVRDRAEAIVAAGISGNIRALNNNGVNFGAQIHELQRAIAQDPDNAAGVISHAYSALRNSPDNAVTWVESGAFRQAMSGLGYGREVQDATTAYNAQLESDRIAERAALSRMSPGERASYMLGQLMDAGAPLGIGAGVAAMAVGPGARVNNRNVAAPAETTVTISRSRYPESARHIEDAQAQGHPSTVTIDRGGARERRAESLRGTPRQPGLDRDEYPPAVSQEGGAGASIRAIPPGDNRGAGSTLGRQIQRVPDGGQVTIRTGE